MPAIGDKTPDRVTLIDKLEYEFVGALIELTTADLEKLYTRFVVERTATMRVMIRQEVI